MIVRGPRGRIGLALGLCWLIIAIGPPPADASEFAAMMSFAAKMAREGNWREARFRWERALREEPDNPRLLNNLSVAHEALGDPTRSAELYARANALSQGDENIVTNLRRYEQAWLRLAGPGDANPPAAGPAPTAAGDEPSIARRSTEASKGKPLKVTVSLPVPARLSLEGVRNLLVTSFLGDQNTLLDANRELVRFLRGEFRKGTALDVLDITPAPAIPEQTLADLLANQGFWRHLGREYGADLIVTGLVSYDRSDASGFRSVDVTSPTTGQKVRQTRFVEQEQFSFRLDIAFIDGATGEVRFHDRLQRGAAFPGQENDPVSAFYELSDTIVADVLAVVTPRSIADTRIIFKN